MVSKGLVVAVIVAIATIIGAMAAVYSTQASIDFYLSNPQNLYFKRGLNQVTTYCENGGSMDGDFNLIVTFTNATFSNQTAYPYVVVDNSTAKFAFVLHKGESNNKVVQFTIDNATTEFSITLTLEKTDPLGFLFLRANGLYPTRLQYQWNETSQSFNYVNPT
jgi:hypothetical protein